MDFKKLILILLLFLPLATHAAIATPWEASSTDKGYIQPNPINGNNPFLKIFSTATSTFANGINLTSGCFSIGGVCIGGSSGAGTVTQINTAYPILGGPITTTGTLSLAFGTTTANTWSALQTFTAGFISQASSTIATLHLGNPLEVASGGTGTTTGGVTNGVEYYNGANLTNNSGFVYSSGNVGIGDANPASTLTVDGGAVAIPFTVNDAGTSLLALHQFTSTNNGLYVSGKNAIQSSGNQVIFANDAGTATLLFRTGGVTALTINSSSAALFTGIVGTGTTTPWGQLSASSTSSFPTLAIQQNGSGPAGVFLGGNVGIGSTTPGSLLSIGNAGGINFTLATSTFSTTGGINITSGCYAVNGTCITTGGGGGSVTAVTATYPILSSGGTAPNISTAFGTTTANTFSALNTFNGGLTIGSLSGTINANNGVTYATATSTPTVTAPLTYSGTLGSFIGGVSGTFACTNASSGVTGCLTGTDWNTFNGKQAAGNYITALTGDVTAAGPGSVAATLATVNGNVGTFTYPSVTVNGKGLITAISNGTAPTTYTAIYPITLTGSAFGLAFGTTTSNTWAGTQTFTNAPDFASISNGTMNISGGLVYSTPTTTPVIGTGLSYSGTWPAGIGGVAGTLTNTGVTSIVAGTGISISGATGAVTITATGSGGSAYPFVGTTDGGVAVQATTTSPLADLTPGLALDVGVTGWYGIGGKLLAYASSTNADTIFGLGAGGNNATTSATNAAETAFGWQALVGNSTGLRDTAFGAFAGQFATGNDNAAFGYAAMGNGLTTGTQNIAFGTQSLNQDTSGGDNIGIGYAASYGNTTGFENVSIGSFANYQNIAASNNVSIGYLSGYGAGAVHASKANTFVGNQTGENIQTDGDFNTFIGEASGFADTIGNDNILIGAQAGQNISSGSNNLLIGFNTIPPLGNTVNNQLNIDNEIFGTNLTATSSSGTVIPALTGYLGIGTTTPHSLLELATSTGPQLNLYDGSANSPWNFIERNGSLWFATSSLTTFATSSNSIFSIIPSTTANATTTFSFTDWVLKQTSQTAFNILDGFGTHVVGVNTASTTGNLYQVNASTTPDAAFWNPCGSPSATTPSCAFAIDSYGHIMASTTSATPTLSCAPSGGTLSANSNDDAGTITGGTLSTSCTVTFAHAYGSTPTVIVSGSNVQTGVTSQSTTAFTVTMTATTGDVIQYLVVQP